MGPVILSGKRRFYFLSTVAALSPMLALLEVGGPALMRLGILGFSVSLILLADAAIAQQIYRREPAKGLIPAGQKVLVDNGRCPPGQILELTGGTNPGLRARHGQSTERERRCIPRG
ncbi:hypothetical protein ARD30_18385 [Bosea thiooxidans]|uniref:Uncharacterized protein n=1 Tax=Bosea thiooxidans TaxID=53254 RepID=A0A0Q3SUY8_9HYPH|nr:DUF6719 family protein [Bosea thiooxidans]KQK29210.1 hypothetical protein ARD30_18385 [Bosea thiooxidans]SKB40437.1 hypothetical protein SAMN05660750_00608 [Bosea thiooxidans]